MGDGALVEFASVVDAVECAVAVQRGVAERQASCRRTGASRSVSASTSATSSSRATTFYGDGVNVAARLEALAEPGGICVARTVHDQVKDKLAFGFERSVSTGSRTSRAGHGVSSDPRCPAPMAKVLGLRRAGSTRGAGRAAAAAVVLLVAAGGAGLWLRSDDGAPPAPEQAMTPVTASEAPAALPQAPLDKYRIAVLPFANISADAEDEYFSDGMTEELISKLSRLHDLTVIARTSIMQYKGTGKSIAEIGRELQVGTILEGSVRKAGDRLRITAQLIDVASQGHLWSQDYDRTLDDVFAIQSDVAESVADALEVTLGPGEKRQLEKQGTQNLEAYQLYLRGLHLFHRVSEEGLKNSITYFERALQHDPGFAQAYAGIAMAYHAAGFAAFSRRKTPLKEPELRQRRLSSSTTRLSRPSWWWRVRGQILDYDQARAKLAYKRAVELAPNSAVAHDFYGIMYLSPMGRHDEAIARIEARG